MADDGLNVTWSEVVCPGFRVTGNDGADRENPVPEMVAELMVRAAFPLERMVMVCAVGVATVTFPKATDVGLTAIWAVDASNCSEKVLLTPPAVAVSVTV